MAVDGTGKIHLSTTGSFSVPGVSGGDEDVFTFVPTALGSTTNGTYESTLFFDASVFGLEGNDVTGIDLPPVPPGGMASSAALVLGSGSPAPAVGTATKNTATLLAREQLFSSYGTAQDDLLAVLPGGNANSSSVSNTVLHSVETDEERSAIELALEDVFGNAV